MRVVVLAAVMLCGCAAGLEKPVFHKDGVPQSVQNREEAECSYDVAKAVQTPSQGMRSIVGQELDLAVRRNELLKQCMAARGYRTL